jgi:hypothetical protein
MASTVTLQRSVTLASAFLRYAPLTLSANDPALSNADWVRQFILSPPYAWRWNRAEVAPITCVIGVSDYTVAASNFGWIEKAVVASPENGQESWELTVVNDLISDPMPNLPQRISVQLDDDAGNITFRLSPTPNQAYTLNVTYQKSAPQFVDLTSVWTPLPDYFSYIYNQGFFAKCCEYMSDPRMAEAMQLFVQLVSAANQGIEDTQKNIHQADRLNTQREILNVGQGKS